MSRAPALLIFGHGYSGAAIGRLAAGLGWQVAATLRAPAVAAAGRVRLIRFGDADAVAAAIAAASHVVSTVPPGAAGDPVLAAYGAAIAAGGVRWCGYLSTTGVYGDRGGGWVDEASVPAPTSDRGRRRLAAEGEWAALASGEGAAGGVAVDLCRVAGIYGPGRSVFDDLRAGTARRIVAPDHAFGRIHRDDIAGAVTAAAMRPGVEGRGMGVRVLNLSDDEPAPSAEVIEAAAAMLGIAPPPARTLAEAQAGMSVMALSFWAENRRVASAATQAAIGWRWRYPSYREGLRAILHGEGKLVER